jgi:hypothetical protein
MPRLIYKMFEPGKKYFELGTSILPYCKQILCQEELRRLILVSSAALEMSALEEHNFLQGTCI